MGVTSKNLNQKKCEKNEIKLNVPLGSLTIKSGDIDHTRLLNTSKTNRPIALQNVVGIVF